MGLDQANKTIEKLIALTTISVLVSDLKEESVGDAIGEEKLAQGIQNLEAAKINVPEITEQKSSEMG